MQYFWQCALGITVLNSLIMRLQAQKLITAQPELAGGYRQLFWGTLLFFSLPWLVMGSCIALETPFFLTFFLTCELELLLFVMWVFLLGGAEFYVKYVTPLASASFWDLGLPTLKSPQGVKRFATFALGASLIFWLCVFPLFFSAFVQS